MARNIRVSSCWLCDWSVEIPSVCLAVGLAARPSLPSFLPSFLPPTLSLPPPLTSSHPSPAYARRTKSTPAKERWQSPGVFVHSAETLDENTEMGVPFQKLQTRVRDCSFAPDWLQGGEASTNLQHPREIRVQQSQARLGMMEEWGEDKAAFRLTSGCIRGGGETPQTPNTPLVQFLSQPLEFSHNCDAGDSCITVINLTWL